MADLVVRPRFERPTAPNNGWWKGALGGALWEAPLYVAIAAATLNSYRTPDRIRDKTYIRQDQPSQAWIATPVNALLAQTWPGVEPRASSSYRTPDRIRDKTYIRQTFPNDGWLKGVLNLWEAPLYAPMGDQGRAIYRTPARVPDRTYTRNTTPNSGWEFASQAAFNPATFPPIVQEASSFRTASRDMGVRPTQPNDGWNYIDLNAAIAQRADGVNQDTYRMAGRAKLDVRSTQPNDGWVSTPVNALLAQQVDGVNQDTYRAADRRRGVDVRQTSPNDGWNYVALNAAIAAQSDAVNQDSYRSLDRPELDVRRTAPNDGWWQISGAAFDPAFFPATVQVNSFYWCVRAGTQQFGGGSPPAAPWDSSLSVPPASLLSYRTEPRRVGIDVRQWGGPLDGWWPQPAAFSAALVVPSTNSGGSFRTLARNSSRPSDNQPLDVLYPWDPAFWQAAFEQSSRSFRLADRLRLDVRATAPLDGWWLPTFPAAFNPALYVPPTSLVSYRMADRARLDVRPSQASLEGWVAGPVNANLAVIWPAQTLPSFLVPKRNQDVRPTQPLDGWWFVTFPALNPSLFPPMLDQDRNSYRTRARSVDVRPTLSNEGWWKGSVSLWEAYLWPAVAPTSAIVAPRSKDVRPTQPNDGWWQATFGVFDPALFPAIAAQAAAFRSAARSVDVRPTQPLDAWITTPVNFLLAQMYPAVVLPSYRVAARSTDVRPTLALDGWWPTLPFDVRTYVAVADAWRNSFRTPDRSRDVRPTLVAEGWNILPVNAALAVQAPAIALLAGSFRQGASLFKFVDWFGYNAERPEVIPVNLVTQPIRVIRTATVILDQFGRATSTLGTKQGGNVILDPLKKDPTEL